MTTKDDEQPTEPGPARPIAPASPSRRPPTDITIDATARSFYKEAVGYGFALGDFVRFASALLGIAMASPRDEGSFASPASYRDERYRSLPLVGPKMTIRPFGEPGDREQLRSWVADNDGRFFLLSTASGRTQNVDRVVEDPSNRIGMVTVVGRPVGCVAYLDYRADQGRAELRKMIGVPEMRGRGLGREAAKLWLGYGFMGLGLRKVYLTTLLTHLGNIKINEEMGFRVEGILRNEVFVDGEYRDVLRMGLCER